MHAAHSLWGTACYLLRHHLTKLSARCSSIRSLRKINELRNLLRKAQSGSYRESHDSGSIGDSVTWSTEIYPYLLCDGVISIRLALSRVRYIEHLF